MKVVVVASKNPVKIQATKGGFEKMFSSEQFDIVWESISSGVKDQPDTNEETLRWATNRAMRAFDARDDADYGVWIEWWVERTAEWLLSFGRIVVKGKEKIGRARAASFFLPPRIAELIEEWKELWEADDIVFWLKNSKQSAWAIWILTDGVLSREAFCEFAVIQALVPFKNPDLYV